MEIESLYYKINNISQRRQRTIQHIWHQKRASRIKEQLGEQPHPQDQERYKDPVGGFSGPDAVGLKEYTEARRT